jgi:putative redox protein
MATIETKYLGELRCESTHVKTGSSLLTDAPVDNCGRGSTFSPTDLLTTALLNCMITIMGIHANDNSLVLNNLKATAVKKMGVNPRRVVEAEIEITLDGSNLNEHERAALESAALSCPVAKSLSADLLQTVTFNYH